MGSCRQGEEAWMLWKAGMYGDISLSDGVIEYAKTHEELKGAFLTFQKDADQIYPGWKEKLGYTGESSVQAASFDWQKKAAAATFATHTFDQAPAFFYEKNANAEAEYWADAGYFASGDSVVKVGNAQFAGHEQGADPHVNGSPLPPSEYVNSNGYLADGTAMGKVGNDLIH